MSLTGIILANTGTPSDPSPAAVRKYLRQFLSDQRIIHTPRLLWLPILHGMVLPLRPRRSAQLYQRTWTADGSPLRHLSMSLAARLEKHLNERAAGNSHRAHLAGTPVSGPRSKNSSVAGDSDRKQFRVVVGMRYGTPAISAAVRELAAVDRLVLLPMFPQVSGTTTLSMYDGFSQALDALPHPPHVVRVGDFATHETYIHSQATAIESHWQTHGKPGHLVMSFHGIPVSYETEGDRYRHRCIATARHIAAALELSETEYTITFQSRFGPAKWLQPYTVDRLAQLAARQLDRVDVVCPGFLVDCLETLDEMDREARRHYQECGGSGFSYIRALNDTDGAVKTLTAVLDSIIS